MKKGALIAQWVFAVLFGICVLGNGLHWTSLPLLLATLLMLPIDKIRKVLNGIKLKNWLIITLAVILFFFGIMCSPTSNENDNPNDNPSYSDGITTDDDNPTSDSSTTPPLSSEDDNSTENPSGTDNSETDNNTSDSNETEDTNDNPTDLPNEGGTPPQDQAPSSVGNGIATPVNPATLPIYSGSPYVIVNNNIPSFSQSELTIVGYEKYSNLDSLGRCGVAIASCGKEIMPADGEERGSISSIKPSGWIQAKYDGVSGGYLWNRCHLIGWQLSAENANKKNLITGTRYMNVSGMLPFENMVADYIQETNNHVAYRVTPIFEGNNLVCSGVQIEAYSIEDKGEGIQFNVYCYNVQPGITIDYATGSSTSNTQSDNQNNNNNTSTDNNTTTSNPNTSESDMVWIPSSGSKYHSSSSCSNMKNPTQVTKEEAEKLGYEPCKRCH